jgi:hypothetical protein
LDSIIAARKPENNLVLVIDDASTDMETKSMLIGCPYEVVLKKERKGIKDSLMLGCRLLFDSGCDIVMNFDSDAIISNNAIEVILELKLHYPDRIVTGFHSTTKNADGTERHIILDELIGAYVKKSVGGINMCFDKLLYEKYMLPALQDIGNWDHKTSIACHNDGVAILSVRVSVVEHIGWVSAMGHTSGIEKPDTAHNFKPIHLLNVTLIAVDDNVDGIIRAADISCRDIKFGVVNLLSSAPSNDPRVIPIRKLGSKQAYSEFLLKEISDYIETDFFVTIQADGYILMGQSWDDSWFNYDYIGSPWEWYTDGMNVGNGAASFRSKRLHKTLKEDKSIIPANDDLIKEFQEDHNIARIYRRYLERQHGIKFAPIEVARKFGIEAWNVKPPGNKYDNQFCFHGKHVNFQGAQLTHIPY